MRVTIGNWGDICCVFQALINSLVCWFCTSTLGLVLFQIWKEKKRKRKKRNKTPPPTKYHSKMANTVLIEMFGYLSAFSGGGAKNAVMATRYMWSETLSGSVTPWSTHPVRRTRCNKCTCIVLLNQVNASHKSQVCSFSSGMKGLHLHHG